MATVRLQLRRGIADDWFDANPTLAAGEIGIETDTNTFKFGDGTTPWNSLEYALSGTVDDYIALSLKGVANGVASLDGSGLIPLAQLPGAAALDAEVSSAITAHNDDTTSVHGIADTSILVTTTGTQTLMAKSLTSPTLTGTPVAPTATVGTDTTQVATTAFVQDAIEAVIGAAPDALNTLAEIASSLNDNADLSGTLTSAISEKVAKAGDTMSGALNMGTNKITGLGAPTSLADATNKSYVDEAIGNNLSTHSADQTNVHGITNTQNLVYTDDVRLSDLREPQNDSVTTAKILDLNVTTAKINDSAITAAKIATDAVTTEKINALAVTSAKIDDDAVTSVKIADSAVETAKIDDSAVTSIKIDASAVTTEKINDSAVTALKIAADAVVTEKINNSAVTTAKINDSAITEDKIADVNVTTPKIADSAITTAKVNNSAVTEDKIAGLAVTEGKIADGAVSTAKIADSAITSGKIAAGAVDTADIADSAVTSAKIAANAISQSHLSDDSVGTNEIGGLAVTTGKIADGAVTTAKIADGAVTKTMVGLANAENTSDADKPVSTATQTALDAKASLAGAAFTGNVEVDGNLVVDGDFTVNGTNFSASATSITIEDNMVQLAHQNAANTVDLGLVVGYNDGAAKHAGLVRDVSDAKWKLFKGVTTEPSTTVDFTQGSLDDLKVAALEATTITPSSGVVFSDGTQTKQGVPSLTTIASATSGAYNLSTGGLTLRDQLIPIGGTHAITVPTNATTAFPVGTSISFYQSAGTGGNFVAADGTVTILSTPGSTLRALYSSATLTKVATNTWLLAGDLRA